MSELIHGECLEEMAKMDDNSIDLILCDPPYGTTQCKWDQIIPVDEMWEQCKRIIKPGRGMIFLSAQPYSSILVSGNIKEFKYSMVWNKVTARGHLVAKKRVMAQHEDILVFGKGGILYNPQMVELEKPTKAGVERKRTEIMGGKGEKTNYSTNKVRTHAYPKSILTHSMDKRVGHPTQKPVSLFEWLIKTYSDENDTVLDFAAGSGTTAIAALNTNREYICIEKDDDYFELMKNRVENHVLPAKT